MYSERAIGRTFHEIYVNGFGERSQWGACIIDKNGLDK